jgi:hypothetical protein
MSKVFLNIIKNLKCRFVLCQIMLLLLLVSVTLYGKTNQSGDSRDTLAPRITYTLECDGSVKNGYVKDMPEDSIIRSNLSNIILFAKNTNNYKFRYDNFTPGISQSTSWYLDVEDKFKDAHAEIAFIDMNGNADTVISDYVSPKILIIPPSADFGKIRAGIEVFKEYLLINQSPVSYLTVDKIDVKGGKSSFRVDGYEPFTFVKPLDTLKFRVNFKAIQSGFYKDSIGVGCNNCIFGFMSYISAEVVSPVIEVEDVFFDNVTIGDTTNRELTIWNRGNVELTINDVKQFHTSSFKAYLPEISNLKPLIISAGNFYKFQVRFKPFVEESHLDSLVFSSNAATYDSVCHVTAIGVKPGLIANSYDWGKRRIDRSPKFPAGPYRAGNHAIILRNTGSNTVTINRAIFENKLRAEAFEFDSNRFHNIVLSPNTSDTVQVEFHPKEYGLYGLTIKYENSLGSPTETRLAGIGVVPDIKVENIDFDTTVVNFYLTPQNRRVKITNKEWEFSDRLRIEDLVVGGIGNEISDDITKYGKEGFKYDKSRITLPKFLEIGESLDFDAYYVAQHNGKAIGVVNIISDALTESSTSFTGFGITQGLRLTGDDTEICIGDTSIIRCYAENYGSEKIIVDSIRFENNSIEYSLLDLSLSNNFILDVGEKREIDVLFHPEKPGDKINKLLVYNNTENMNLVKTDLPGRAIFTQRIISLAVKDNNLLPSLKDTLSITYKLEDGEDIENLNIKEVIIECVYPPNILRPSGQPILSDTLNGKFILDKFNNDTLNGILSFTLKGLSTEKFYKSGDLFSVLYLPLMTSSENTPNSGSVSFRLTPSSTKCVEFKDLNRIAIKLNHEVNENLKWIDGRRNSDTLLIYPNPSIGGDTKIVFSIKNPGNCKVFFCDLLGKTITTAFDGSLLTGVYEISIDTSVYLPGIYFCRLITASGVVTIKFEKL